MGMTLESAPFYTIIQLGHPANKHTATKRDDGKWYSNAHGRVVYVDHRDVTAIIHIPGEAKPKKLIETRIRYIHRHRPEYIYTLSGTVEAENLVVTDHWMKDNAIAWIEERVIYNPEPWSTDI